MHHDKLISMQSKPVHFIVRALHKRKSARYQECYVIQTQQCVACGACAKICGHRAIQKNTMGQYEIDTVMCHRCGACAATCPKQAILCASGSKRNNNR